MRHNIYNLMSFNKYKIGIMKTYKEITTPILYVSTATS